MRLLRLWIPPLLWAVLILSASNDSFSARSSEGWFERLTGHPLPWAVNVAIRKTAHVIEYSILSLLVFRAAAGSGSRTAGLIVAIAFCLAVASADELRQSRTRERTGRAADVVLDTSAATAAALIAWRLSARRREAG